MKKNIFLTLFLAVCIALPGISQTVNELSKKEKKEGWVLLFNGKNFDGWRQCNGTAMPAKWVIEENAMKVFTAAAKKPGPSYNADVHYSL